jgi:serine/threonine protein kinase
MEIILAGRYQIDRHIGRGGFGETFLAQDIYLPGHPFCVVKKLKPRVKNPTVFETAKRLFDREAESLHKLGNHDQIPHLLANFEEKKNFYLVQEFIDGHTLQEELTPGKQLNEACVIRLLHDILQVLSFVHQQRVIHRDIKPPNLMRRNKDDKIVLIDFGAVKEVTTLAANSDGNTSLTVAVGSPGYMPSEQQAFKPHFSSDVYAVGMIGIQALTGLSPNKIEPSFDTGEISCASFKKIVSISPPLAEILDRMVRYDYRQRYNTAKEALEALEKLIAGQSKISKNVATIAEIPNNVKNNLKTQPNIEKVSSLNPKFLEFCRRELALYVGPFANFMIDDILIENPQINSKQLVEMLGAEIPKEALQALEKLLTRQFKDEILEKLDLTSKYYSKVEGISLVNPEFLERCRKKLALYVGPFANYIIDDILREHPQINAKELIEKLAAEIPDPKKAKEFKQYLLANVN